MVVSIKEKFENVSKTFQTKRNQTNKKTKKPHIYVPVKFAIYRNKRTFWHDDIFRFSSDCGCKILICKAAGRYSRQIEKMHSRKEAHSFQVRKSRTVRSAKNKRVVKYCGEFLFSEISGHWKVIAQIISRFSPSVFYRTDQGLFKLTGQLSLQWSFFTL